MASGVTRGLGANSSFARQVARSAAKKSVPILRSVAENAERFADDIISDEYATGRSPERRRSGRTLLGSFVAEVEGTEFPLNIRLRSTAPRVKVHSLNYGSQPHAIQGNPKLSFPNTKVAGGSLVHVPSPARFAQAYGRQRIGKAPGRSTARSPLRPGGVKNVVVDSVQHPGTGASHFLERALERAVQAAYSQAVKASRAK